MFNPTAGRARRRRLVRVLEHLKRRGIVVTLRVTHAEGDAERIAGEASRANCDRLVVAGGDGTINETVNGLTARDLPLAIVPSGTANVLAHEIGMPRGARAIARLIAEGSARPMALGRVDGRRFVMMAGIGFDARVVANLDSRLKRWTGRAAYGIEILRRLIFYRPIAYEAVIDGAPYRAYSAVIANGSRYGGRFVLTREARLDEPRLAVCLFNRGRRRDVLRYLLALGLGRLDKLGDVTIVPAARVEVNGPTGEPVQVDGDPRAVLPARFTVEPDALLLVRPD